MLNIVALKQQIHIGLTQIYKPAIETMILMLFPEKTDVSDKLAKDMAESFDEMTADAMSDVLASAIDYYVKNISVNGILIDSGLGVNVVVPAPTPQQAGKIPNTLGII